MSDLIKRQDAIEIIQSMYPGMPRVPWTRKNWQKRYEPYIRTENAIRELPSAERKGHWYVLDECANEGVYCSKCHKKVFKIDYSNTMKWKNFNFCPNCGADMRGEQE